MQNANSFIFEIIPAHQYRKCRVSLKNYGMRWMVHGITAILFKRNPFPIDSGLLQRYWGSLLNQQLSSFATKWILNGPERRTTFLEGLVWRVHEYYSSVPFQQHFHPNRIIWKNGSHSVKTSTHFVVFHWILTNFSYIWQKVGHFWIDRGMSCPAKIVCYRPLLSLIFRTSVQHSLGIGKWKSTIQTEVSTLRMKKNSLRIPTSNITQWRCDQLIEMCAIIPHCELNFIRSSPENPLSVDVLQNV